MLKTTLDNGPRMKWLASKVTVDDERSCFWTRDDTECCLAVQTLQGAASWKEEKEREKESTKVYPKEAEEHSLAKNKHKIPKFGQKRTLLGGPQETKARKACQKGKDGYQKGGFRPYQPDKGAGKDYHHNKGKGKDQKGKGKEGTYPQSGFSSSETPNEKGIQPCLWMRRLVCQPWDWRFLDFRYCVVLHKSSHCLVGGTLFESCLPSDTRGSWPWLHTVDWIESGQSKDWRSMHGIMVLRRNLAVVMSLSCSPTPRQKPAWKVALSTFQRHHHVLPRLMCLRQVTCPSCFLLPQMKNLEYDLWTGSKKRQDHVPSFRLVFFSS